MSPELQVKINKFLANISNENFSACLEISKDILKTKQDARFAEEYQKVKQSFNSNK